MTRIPNETATLGDLQQFHSRLDREKAFDQDLLRNVAFLAGELGELVRAIQHLRRSRGAPDEQCLKDCVAEELADVLAYVLKLANYAGVDLQEAYRRKMRRNIDRSWPHLADAAMRADRDAVEQPGGADVKQEPPLVTRSQLIHDLENLGVEAGQTLMLHVSVRAIGWVVGGPDVVLDALLDVLTPEGTLMMYVAWEDSTEDFHEWPSERQAVYRAECPAFDPRTSRAYRKWSILTEYLRTRPGACRSANPGASMAAVGAKAHWLTRHHPLNYGYGPGSPLAKLCEIGGQVLQIGVPLSIVTLLHYSEHVADVPNRRVVRYPAPIVRQGRRTWVEIEEFDTASGIVDWEGDYFETIVGEYLTTGRARSGKVGAAPSHLFDAADLHRYAVAWMEGSFGRT